MELILIAAIVLGLILLDLAAIRFGADSRAGFIEQNPDDYKPVGLFS